MTLEGKIAVTLEGSSDRKVYAIDDILKIDGLKV